MKKNLLKRKKKELPENSSRITNDTVAEHRERVLTGGRKFKYPHQYLRHKLVINAVLLTTLVLVIVGVTGWFQLYVAQNTSDFMYRVTRVLPVPVASVDGSAVRYSDYLMRYRSQELWLRNNGQLGLNPNDERQQLSFFKRSVLDDIERDVFAQKLADEQDIKITDQEIDAVVEEERSTATGKTSNEVFDASILDLLGYSPDEYRHIIRQALVRQRVAFRMDSSAQSTRDVVIDLLSKSKRNAGTLEVIASTLKKQGLEVQYGESGLVPKNNRDGGLTRAALKLSSDEVSEPVESTTRSGDFISFVQRVSVDDKSISYRSLQIPLKEFEAKFQSLKNQQKIKEHITLKSNNTKTK